MSQYTLSKFQASGTECPECGRSDFVNRAGMKKHYGRKHEGSIAGVELLCDHCEEPFRKKESHISETNFCCFECNSEWLSENITGEDTNLWNGGKVEVECDWCGKFFDRKPSHVREKKFCSRECHANWESENQTGQDNPAWNGGHDIYRSLRSQLPKKWEEVRKARRRVDGYECQMCGDTAAEVGRKLDVHHIVPLLSGGLNEAWNLITLCLTCHQKAESKTREILDYNVKQHYEQGGES